MTNEDLTDMMNAVSHEGDVVISTVEKLTTVMDAVYELMEQQHAVERPMPLVHLLDKPISQDNQKVAVNEQDGIRGVSQTSIFNLVTLYVGDMKTLVEAINKYNPAADEACRKIYENQYSFKPRTPIIDDFREFSASLMLTNEAVKGFYDKAVVFNNTLSKYLQSNRTINLDNEILVIKGYNEQITVYVKAHFSPYYSLPAIVLSILNKLIDYSNTHKSF